MRRTANDRCAALRIARRFQRRAQILRAAIVGLMASNLTVPSSSCHRSPCVGGAELVCCMTGALASAAWRCRTTSVNPLVPTGLNWNAQSAGSATPTPVDRLDARRTAPDWRRGQTVEDRKVGQRGEQAAREDDRLAADLVRQPAEEHEERRAEQRAPGDQQVRRCSRRPSAMRCQEEQRVELARVPHHALAGGEAEQREQRRSSVVPAAERFGQRRLGRLALCLHLLEGRRFVAAAGGSTREIASSTIETRNGMPPAPGLEGLLADARA